ncbi:MmpS family transport accessory protein [Pedobacter nototheniae]|uniref:MmpS family transport accessory protein n=1 Tax=Pedobacter nototheniae TaxID=2488994 RepID=UPI00103E014E|nr:MULTISPECIES: MmpS family transport accessory protein [Pedobacter]
MKKLLSALLLLTVLSSCSLSIHYLQRGKLNIPEKETYVVTYQAMLDENTSAKISYLDENGKRQKIKDFKGKWEKIMVMKSGSKTRIKVTGKGDKARGEFKVLVDGKVVGEQILTNKKIVFGLSFILP